MNTKMTLRLTGRVTGQQGQHFAVQSPDAPAHLRLLHLTRPQMRGAVVGDHVTIEYFSTVLYGLWSVVEILGHCPDCDKLAPLSDASEAGLIFTDEICDSCRDAAIREIQMDAFDRDYAHAIANGWAD